MMEKGDFFGEMSILEGLPRTISAEAVEDSELIEINSMTFDKMIKGNIEIAIRMLRKLSIRLRETERRIEELQADGPVGAAAGPPAASAPKRRRGRGHRHASRGRKARRASSPCRRSETLIGRFDPVTEQMPDVDLTAGRPQAQRLAPSRPDRPHERRLLR